MKHMIALAAATSFILLTPGSTESQQEDTTTTIDMNGEPVEVVDRTDGTIVLQGEGARLYPRRAERITWYMIQDSSLGPVFTEPSGLKEGTDGDFDGDLDLRFTERVHALETKTLVFDAWNNFVGTYRFTCVCFQDEGDEDGLDPRWSDFKGKSDEIWTTITYVSRVRLPDGTIKQAETQPVAELARSIDPNYQSASDASEELRDLFRELFRRMRLPGASVTLNATADD